MKYVVEHVVRQGPEAIRKLIDFGTQFDKKPDGEILLGQEGGHRSDRVLRANGDATGRELIRSLIAEVQRRPKWHLKVANATTWSNRIHFAGTPRQSPKRKQVKRASDRAQSFI